MKLLLFFALSIVAASLASSTLSWDASLSEARRANPELIQAEQALRQAELGEISARAAFLPRASLSASTGQGGDYRPLDSEWGQLGPAGSPNYGLGLSSSLNLFNGFSSLASLRTAKTRLSLAELQLREARASLAFSLRQAYAQLVFVAEQVELADELAARAKENRDMVELRYEAGAENKGSHLQAKALAAQAQFEADRARRSRRSASLTLSRLLGRGADASLQAEGSLDSPKAPDEPDFEMLLDQLPAVLRAFYQMDQAENTRLGAWSPFLPSLNASGSLNRSGPDWAPQNGSWSAGLSLSLPLFNGFGDLAALHSAKSAEAEARSAGHEARLQARLDLEKAWQDYADAVAALALRAMSLEASQARAEIGRVQYAQGLLGFENWDRIESDLSNARKSALSSRLNAVVSQAAWDRALGKGFEP
jgi:outer membrane protein TolC